MLINDSQFMNNFDLENMCWQNGDGQDSYVFVVIVENSVLISFQVEEISVYEEFSDCFFVFCEKNCIEDGVLVNLFVNLNFCFDVV